MAASEKEANEALLEGCSKGSLTMVLKALGQGANPNAIGEGQKSALERAIQGPAERSERCVEALIDAGATGSAKAVWEAAFNRDQNARYGEYGFLSAVWTAGGVSSLLRAGFDPLAVDESGRDALMKACWAFKIKAAHELLDAGVSPLRRDRHGLQALSMLLHSMAEQGASAGALPVVRTGFDLVERLALMGSDFETSQRGGPGPAERFKDMRLPEARASLSRIHGALAAKKVKTALEQDIPAGEPAAARRPPRV